MPPLTAAEIAVILGALQHQYGPGYSGEVVGGVSVGRLQAKLSVTAEVRQRCEAARKEPADGPQEAG